MPTLRDCLPGCALVIASAFALTAGPAGATGLYELESLVTDDQDALAAAGFEPAAFVDPNLINPWGVSFSSTSPFWVSNQGSATSTLYDGAGTPQSLIVDIPQVGDVAGPTGQIFNSTTSFSLSNGSAGAFFFANLDGSISGWNTGTVAEVVVPAADDARDAIYTGLALASTSGSDYLYAANNLTGQIDVYDTNFAAVSLPGGFTDPGPNPDGLVPFNVQNLNGLLYVTYAVGGPAADEAALGTGFVSVFNPDGSFVGRIAEGGQMVSPWGVTLAPEEGFGKFSGALLIGNFHEDFGYINAFDPESGEFLGSLMDEDGELIVIPDLWALIFGNGGAGGDADDLYFTAGIGDELHGLFGEIEAVPLPAALPLLGGALAGLLGFARRRRGIVGA